MARGFLLGIALLALLAGCKGGPLPSAAPSSAEEQRQWVHTRVEAVADLYSLSSEGRRMFHSLDVRQVVGEPLYFGSFGYRGWTGAGEATPMSVMHELGHAYWGAFPVAGHPDLSWDQPPEGELSSGMAQYRRDLVTFMLQPPDRFEPLRDRLRNFPNLCAGDYSSLYHTGEADMASLTGGDLALVPPILRKYYDRLLGQGPFEEWYSRLRWWAGLPSEERRLAASYLYDSHYPIMEWYEGVPPLERASVGPRTRSLIEQEERQRLVDFALQFPLVTQKGISNVLEWRRYVAEKADLFSRHPDALQGLPQSQAQQLERSLAGLQEARSLSGGAKVKAVSQVLSDPVGSILWFALSPAELVGLQKAGVRPKSSGQRNLDGALGHLRRYMGLAQDVVETGRKDYRLGAAKLREALRAFQGAQKADLDVFSRMLLAWDEDVVAQVLDSADNGVVDTLLEAYPAAVYFLARPGRLLDALGLTEATSAQALAPALSRLLDRTSGNYAIDLPVLEEATRRIVAAGLREPGQVMEALASVHYPLAWLLTHEPDRTLDMLEKDLAAATDLVAAQDGCYASPGAALHRLAYHNPSLAARITVRLWQAGHERLVEDTIAHFAFDSYWGERLTGSPRSAQALAGLASNLAEGQGWPWVRQRFLDGMSRYAARAAEGEYDSCFLAAFARTLEDAARVAGPSDAAEALASLAADAQRRSLAGALCTSL